MFVCFVRTSLAKLRPRRCLVSARLRLCRASPGIGDPFSVLKGTQRTAALETTRTTAKKGDQKGKPKQKSRFPVFPFCPFPHLVRVSWLAAASSHHSEDQYRLQYFLISLPPEGTIKFKKIKQYRLTFFTYTRSRVFEPLNSRPHFKSHNDRLFLLKTFKAPS